MRRQLAYTAAAGTFAISGIAACGTSSGSPTATASLSISPTAAIQKTATYLYQHSFHFTATADANGLTGIGALSPSLASVAGGSQSVTVNLTGDVPKLTDATGTADIKATFSGSGTLVSLAKIFTGGSAVEVRIVGGTITTDTYVNIGQAIGGKHWLALTSNNGSTGQSANTIGGVLGALTVFGDAGDLKVAGAGPGGTVELSATVNEQTVKAAEAKARAAGNDTVAAQLASVDSSLKESPNATLVSDLWIDPATYVPTKATFTLSGVRNAQSADLTVTLSNFGETVTVAAPSASDTYTTKQLEQRLLGK
jgi:hypothetical protein